MAVLQPLPAPARRDTQYRFGQGAEVVSHLLDRQASFHVAGQGAKHLGMVRTAQKIKQCLIVVLASRGQRCAAAFQFLLELTRAKPLAQHRAAGQLVDHPRVEQQIARWPSGTAEQAEQTLVHLRPLQQQGQITFAPQQWFNPVGQAHGSLIRNPALGNPTCRAGHQAHQAHAGLIAQGYEARVDAPCRNARTKTYWQLAQQVFQIGRCSLPGAMAVFACRRIAAKQCVKFLSHRLTMTIKLGQERVCFGVTHGAGDPGQVVILSRQHMGLLIIQILNAMFYLA